MMRLSSAAALAMWVGGIFAASASGCVRTETEVVPGGCDPGQCPATGTACVAPVCAGAECAIANQIAGLTCSDHGGRVCDGKGKCIGCLADADCPAQTGADCLTPSCAPDHSCGTTPVAKGTKLAIQPVGTCQQLVCDGSGKIASVEDDSNVPSDQNPCTMKGCAMGKPTKTPVAGSCLVGGVVCGDPMGPNAGTCVACNTDIDCAPGTFCSGGACIAQGANGAPCSGADQCASGACADGFCCNQACSGACQACGSSLTGAANGTCADVKQGVKRPGTCDAKNGGCANKPCACAGNSPSACLEASGAVCTTAAQCASGTCNIILEMMSGTCM